LSVLCFILTYSSCFANQPKESNVFERTEKYICRIYVEHELDGRKIINRGCGIVLRQTIKESVCYFVCTAYHVVEDLLTVRNVGCEIFVSDFNDIKYWNKNIRAEHIVWRNREMDAAIIALPKNLFHDPFTEGYEFQGISYVKTVTTATIGQEVYMIGYRWHSEKSSTVIFKKGIVSTVTKTLPGYKGHRVFLVDKMSNKGMSGGLLFTNDGRGIAMISSYILESDQRLRTSDDLTVCVPLSVLFKKLKSVILGNEEEILTLIRKE